jgi:ABC-type branched-subunit amino acid transport system permease subunit
VDLVSFGQTVFGGLANGALYAFVGLGFSLISRSTGIINFAQGEFAMLGAVLTGLLSVHGIPLVLAVPIAVLVCGLIGGGLHVLAIQRAERANMAQLIIMTIGFSILIRGAVTWGWGSDPIVVPAFTGSRPLNFFGVTILPQALWLIGTLAIVTVLMWLFFHRTVIGLALRAGAANPLGAAFVGIDHKRLGAYSFVAAGLLGGLGGAVWAPIAFAQVDLGVALSLKGFTAAALGGFGTTFGPIAGGLIFGLVESLSAGFVSSAYQEAIAYGLLLVILIVRPQGLLGTIKRGATDDHREEVLSSGLMPTRITQSDVIRFALTTLIVLVLGSVLTGSWLTSAIFAGITAIVVMGLVLLTGYAGQISLGQGTFMMVGAYSSGYLTLKAGWPAIGALVFGMVLAGVFALILGRFIFRLRGYYLAMASLSLLMIGQTLAREGSSITGGPNGLPGIAPFSIFGAQFFTDEQFYYVVLVFSLLTLVAGLSIARSRVGRALLAIRSDELAARACGTNVVWLKIGSFVFAAACASLAGSLYVHYLGIANPLPFGFNASIFQIVALTLGGFLSLWGSYIGSAIVLAFPSVIMALGGASTSQASAGLQFLIFGLLLVCVIIVQSNASGRRIAGGVRRVFGLGHRSNAVEA